MTLYVKIIPPTTTQDYKIIIPIKDEFSTSFHTKITGEISGLNGLFVKQPLKIKLVIETNHTNFNKTSVLFVPSNVVNSKSLSDLIDMYSDDSLNLNKIGDTYSVENNNLILTKAGTYSILVVFQDEQNKILEKLISSDQFEVYDEFSYIQLKSEKETIGSSPIIEGLSWIVIGASGVAFLAQIGIKDD